MSPQSTVFRLRMLDAPSDVQFVSYARGDRVQVCRLESIRSTGRVAMELHFADAERGPRDINAIESRCAYSALVLPASGNLLRAVVLVEHLARAPEVAAALAVVRYAWAWDERESFAVEVNERSFTVSPRVGEDRSWEVRVVADGDLSAAV